MSSYQVLDAVSDALRGILWEELEKDDILRPLVGSESAIVFSNPSETAQGSSNRLSLWLHQITENEFVKNQPLQRGPASAELRLPPMALNLYFLVTPFGTTSEASHLILGKVMQVLYDNATVLLRDEAGGIFEELRIIFCRLSLEELTRIWEALREAYRLSVCYQVRVTRIDSQRRPRGARVVERDAGFGAKPLEEKAS